MHRGVQKIVGIGGIAAIALALGMGSFSSTALAETSQESVALGGAKTATVRVKLDAGSLDVKGGAASTDLLSGSFDHNGDHGKPKLDYGVAGEHGNLNVTTPGAFDSIDWPWDMVDVPIWKVNLNDAIPTELNVEVQAGQLDLALGGTSVTKLDVKADAADAKVDLSGAWAQNLDATLNANAARLVLIVPDGVGIRIETNTDVSDTTIETSSLHETSNGVYENDAYARAPVKLTINATIDADQLKVQSA